MYERELMDLIATLDLIDNSAKRAYWSRIVGNAAKDGPIGMTEVRCHAKTLNS